MIHRYLLLFTNFCLDVRKSTSSALKQRGEEAESGREVEQKDVSNWFCLPQESRVR